jgi:hypothetical protein
MDKKMNMKMYERLIEPERVCEPAIQVPTSLSYFAYSRYRWSGQNITYR